MYWFQLFLEKEIKFFTNLFEFAKSLSLREAKEEARWLEEIALEEVKVIAWVAKTRRIKEAKRIITKANKASSVKTNALNRCER